LGTSLCHGVLKRLIDGHSAGQTNRIDTILLGGSDGFFNEHIDHGLLETAGNVAKMRLGFFWTNCVCMVQHSCFQTAETEIKAPPF
jgi:hypothetical protein